MPQALIVDDEPGIRFALKRWFERQGYSVREADSGDSAVAALISNEAADSNEFDVVVCDLNLPGMSGDALLQRLALERPAIVSRVILTTGDAIVDAAPDSVLANHPHVLQKPFDLATLKTMVDRVTDRA
jgi:DNA-binding NtrC family response regulator